MSSLARKEGSALSAPEAVLVAVLLATGLALQVHFFRTYPQPVLFGDPAEYATLGHHLLRAASRAISHPRAAFATFRGSLYMLGVSTVFAALEALRPEDWGFARIVMAAFNTVAMLGAFLLGRELGRSYRGGILALAAACVYPSFSVETGRLYPDPVTSSFFVFAAYFLVRAVRDDAPGAAVVSGLLLSGGLFIRSQILDFMFLFVGALALATAPLWFRRAEARRIVLAFLVSLVPLLATWVGIRTVVGQDVDPFVQLGNETFKPYYPYGFWQYLDSDGWIGPYRLKTEPYARALQEAQKADPALLRSFPAQLGFTARYVRSRFTESVLLVLDNVYRLYDRPANDYKWDYPFPYRGQVLLQRAIVVLGLAGAAFFVAESPVLAVAFLIPLALAALHGLVFPWPRYNLPAMPILMGAAGAGVSRILERLPPRGPAIVVALLAALGSGAAALLGGPTPEIGRLLAVSSLLAALAFPFALLEGPGRLFLAFAGLATLVLGHEARSRTWHEFAISVGGATPGVEQEIALDAGAWERLRKADEAFLALDLQAPEGDLGGARLSVNGQDLPPSALEGALPRLPESTSTGGRDARGYPQWWVVRLGPALLAGSPGGTFRVRLLADRKTLLLKGDHFRGEQGSYEGPSFGDWPHAVDLKLEYDGDNRIGVRVPLGSLRTESRVLGPDGAPRPLRGVLRIRLLTLKNDVGRVVFESAPVPKEGGSVVFRAFSGRKGDATLAVADHQAATLALGSGDFEAPGTPFGVCYRRQDEKTGKGVYLVEGPFDPGPVRFTLRYLTGMSLEPRYFVPDLDARPDEIAAALDGCARRTPILVPLARVVDRSGEVYPDTFRSWIKVALGHAFPEPEGESPFRWSVGEVY
jgi:hypothetical protein